MSNIEPLVKTIELLSKEAATKAVIDLQRDLIMGYFGPEKEGVLDFLDSMIVLDGNFSKENLLAILSLMIYQQNK
jgi:hypothetical protein